ncbi:MAG: iron ABC transporter permease, partial [Actinomycetota bacterium]|nr:iron ABC transporter permease [Actinomycetota bacterium]
MLRPGRLRPWWLVAGGLAVLVVALTGLVIGPVVIAPGEVIRDLLGMRTNLSPTEIAIIEQIRLPRVVLGLLVGGTLAISGASYQGVFRNPLADPYLLGAAAGAGLAVTIVIT